MKRSRWTVNSIVFSVFLVMMAGCSPSSDSGKTIPARQVADVQAGNEKNYEFTRDGELLRESLGDYRRWVYVGTPLTPNELNPPEAAFPEFHNVYIHPEDYDHWEAKGSWRDGTILVKELVSVGKKQEVSGNGYFMGDFLGLEVTIKDADRFADEPGNWAYFSFGHSYPLADKAKAFPTASCNACHAASAADDFVFTQDYPVLRAAKPSN